MERNCSSDALFHPERFEAFADGVPALVPGRTAFDLNMAYFLSNAAHLAYFNEAGVEATLSRIGFQLRHFWSEASTHAYLAENADLAILAFRGTEAEDWKDIATDSDFRFVETMSVGVHRGFHGALDQVWLQIEGQLKDFRKPLYFTGHSLGGALALLAAARHQPATVYAIGAPKVGDKRFCDQFGTIPVYRLENCCDIVPTVPPGFTGYCNVGTRVFLCNDGEILFDPDTPVMLRERGKAGLEHAGAVPLFRRNTLIYRWLIDHSILNYSSALHAEMKKPHPE